MVTDNSVTTAKKYLTQNKRKRYGNALYELSKVNSQFSSTFVLVSTNQTIYREIMKINSFATCLLEHCQ